MRLQRQGYRFRNAVENVGWSDRGMEHVIDMWIDSPGHRRNMLLKSGEEYGLAGSGVYWALVVAEPR